MEPEENITDVTFVLVKPSGKILMQERDDGRGEEKIKYPNMWCFPGGNKEGEESLVETVIREIKEEFELEVERKDIAFVSVYEHDGVKDCVYLCKVNEDAKPVLNEGRSMDWKTIEEIEKMNLAWEQNKILPEIEKNLQV